MVFLLDPLSKDAFDIFPVIEMLVRGQIPIRVGFLFQPSYNNPNLGSVRKADADPISDVFISSFYHLYLNSPASALTFLSKVKKQT